MNKRRLLKLADLLEADAKNKKGIKFDLGTWACPADNGWTNTFSEKPNEVKVDCGTTACAVGLACVSGAFKKSGLTYGYKKAWVGGGYILVPKFGRLREFGAVQKFFGLDKRAAYFLFTTDEYPAGKSIGAAGERFVAKRIRDFVAGKAKAT